MNGYPKGVELLGFILVKAFDNSHLVNTTNLMFLPLGVLGIAYLTRALSTSSEIALFAGTAFILVPVNIWQASTTCVDSSYASCAIAFIAAVLHAQSNLVSALSIPWTVLPALGGAMGLTMSAKGSGALLAVIGTLLLVTVILFKLVSTPRKRWGSLMARAILFLVLAAAIGAVVGGYWYLRNYLVTGSPLYPIGITIANHTIFPGLSVAESINLVANTPERMRSWPGLMKLLYTWLQGLWNWPSTIYGVDSRLGGLGYLWILGSVPAMLFLFYRYIRYPQSHGHRRFLLVLLAVTGIAFLSTPMNWWARYTLWIYALGLPCFAVVLDGIVGTGQRRLPVRLWALACLVVLVLEGSMCLGRVGASSYPGSWRANPLGVLHRQNWQWPVCYTFPGMSGTIFDQIFTSDAAVAVGPLKGRRKMIMGQLSLPIGHRTIIPLQENLEQDSINRILLQHVRYVIWDDGLSVPAALNQLAVRTDHVSDFWVLTLIVSPGEYVWHEGEAFLSQSGSSATDFKAPASNGQCLGMGWGSRRGDFVEYEVDLPFNLPLAVLHLRYAREGRWAAELHVYASGKLIAARPSMLLKPTGGCGYKADEWAYQKLLLGSMEAGKYRIKFVSLVDGGGVDIDGFFITDTSFTPPAEF